MAVKLSIDVAARDVKSWQSKKDFSFPKARRLLKRRDFLFVRKECLFFATRSLFFTIKVVPTSLVSRFGITLSKKFGDAVHRNKMRRRLREIIRQTFVHGSFWIEIRPKRSAIERSFCELKSEFSAMLAHIESQIRESSECPPF